MMKKLIGTLIIMLLLSNQCIAAIIDPELEFDTYFYDTNTEYTWFDLSYFENRSYNYVETFLKSDPKYDGFQIATLAQIEELLSSKHDVNGVEKYYTKTYYPYLWNIMGGTKVTTGSGWYPILGGLFDFGFEEFSNLGWLYNYSNLGPSYAYNGLIMEYVPGGKDPFIEKDRTYGYLGVWVVNTLTADNDIAPQPDAIAAPEPSTLLLYAAGLLGLAAFRKTRRS